MTKEEGYAKIAELIERFSEQIDSYKKGSYNETQTRRDFIDPFFKALGWDVDNSAGNAEAYREVIHEAKTMVQEGAGERMKSPDYAFRLPGGKYLFFVEAKKPSVMIKDDVIPAYQVRRYGWSAKLAVSITTDFEEFAVYDCTKKPNQGDKASVARIKYLRYDQYLEEFDFLWDTFSKERVLKGSFDKFISNDAARKGTASVDKEFLQSLDKWRTLLATNINQNNHNLDEGELNFAVQQTIDRLIFLRIAEDRGVEEYGTLKKAVKSGTYYKNMVELFKKADEKYNSGLFNFDNDFVTTTMTVSNAAIKDIIIELYYPISPYEFSVLSVEILGSAYEQFLGKQICINAKGKAVIEEKPSVRKAGGVYYTPQYIVDYIVQQTVGALCKGKTPKAVESLTIIDPACGSGSFLLGAYDYLLRWHKDYYTNNPQPGKNRKEKPLTPDGYLTMAVKKQILLNNIYGVDIDLNAVEVTKLSLLLKCLEGETTASIEEQTTLWGGSILPTLDSNIKSGNSLIGPDFFDISKDDNEIRINKPFNWEKAFSKVFKSGGFDAVIGNPPWGAEFNKESLSYLKNTHKEIIVRMIDSFMYFVHKSYYLLKPNATCGFILPDVLFYQLDNAKLREFLLKHTKLQYLINLGGDVFENVTRPSCIIIFKKEIDVKNKVSVSDLSGIKKTSNTDLNKSSFEVVRQKELSEIPKSLFITSNINHYIVLKKINESSVKNLSEYVDTDGIQRGVSADLKEAFYVTSSQVNNNQLEHNFLKPVMTGGKQVKRYYIEYPDLQVIYTRKGDNFETIPNICKFIDQFKDKITCGEVKENKHPMYALHRAREEKIFLKPEKLVGVITGDKISVAIDSTQSYAADGLYLFGVKDINIKYLMAILNSSLFVILYRLISLENGRVLAQVKPTVLKDLPIKTIDFKNTKEKAHHDEIVRHVENLLKLHAEKQTVTLATRRESIDDRIEHSERKINDIVYALYGITDEERAVIEG